MKNTMTIEEAIALPPSKIGDAFYQRVKDRTKAFIEQGKLAYALTQKTLRKGQSVQSILTDKGCPAGSVGNARKAAAIIEALVIPEHLTESAFDKVVTWRIVRFANKVLGLDKGTAQVIPAETVAEIIGSGASSTEIANELECWHEHKCSPAEHEQKLKDAAAAQKAAEKEAQANADAVAEDDAEADAEESTEESTEDDTEDDTEETPEETPEDAPEESAEETPEETPEAPTPIVQPETQPEGVTVEAVLESIMQTRLDATELDADGLKAVLNEVNEFQQEIIDALEAAKLKAAA